MKNLLLSFVLLLCATFAFSQITIDLELIASGFDNPVDIAHAGDDRLFVVEKDGYIRIINADGTVEATPFLDIDSKVRSNGNEQGLLGLAFHPDYANNGYFYVNYIDNGENTRICRFTVSSNPNIADLSTEILLYAVTQPYSNHNGGDLNFGPDGYLYIGLGDGGSGGDPGNRSQNTGLALGKMLRIDIDNGFTYSIPADNPFVNDPATLNEIWAIGLRNPWRFSFDRLTGDMWIADVGQNEFEEIDFQPANSTGGENYGWRCYEGFEEFNTSGCPSANTLTEPVHAYANNFNNGCSVTGGYVYRGSQFPAFVGLYIYVDYCTGKFWSLQRAGANSWTNTEIATFESYEYSSFGEDKDGELYVTGYANGEIYRIIDPMALPVELVSFEADIINEKEVLTQWSTATEVNADYFEIQRSTDGIGFETLGKVFAAGNSTTLQNYDFLDENPLWGIAYYRLKQVDTDGTYTYFNIIKIELERPYIIPNVYPNPATKSSQLTIDFGQNTNTPIQINITDLAGRQVYQATYEAGQGIFDIPLTQNLNAGIYLISGQFDGYQFYQKLLVY